MHSEHQIEQHPHQEQEHHHEPSKVHVFVLTKEEIEKVSDALADIPAKVAAEAYCLLKNKVMVEITVSHK